MNLEYQSSNMDMEYLGQMTNDFTVRLYRNIFLAVVQIQAAVGKSGPWRARRALAGL